MPGIYLWTALQLHTTFSRKEDRMAEMNDSSSDKPETAPLTSAKLAIADVVGMAIAQAWHTSVTDSRNHTTTTETHGSTSQQPS